MPRKIDLAEFVISAVGPRDLPRDGRPEVALLGRSNVGKSTLINALVRKDIARTSATPGKTRLVNVYRIVTGGVADACAFYLVDLPGYGHTSGGDKARHEFASLVGAYFGARTALAPLAGCILAIDSRHPGLASDADAVRWLSTLAVPTLIVATKADKLSQSEKARLRRDCETAFGQAPLVVSALKGEGLEELWRTIREWTTKGRHSSLE
jgi:GTP-binding protein